MEYRITDDIERLKEVWPPHLISALETLGSPDNLLEVILDLGRVPMARFIDGDHPLSDREITHEDLDYVVARVGNFDADNRGGIERTLHRISAIRNRQGNIVGLTCRVGRAVYGTIDIIEDLITAGKSVLLLGSPGVGKTTMLREAARVLGDNRRVVIVDTSNEIGGDGDVPHPAVGNARRMQVAQPALQHEVMIEAVENHNPEVIIIDEIGRELEAQAARTIAERGVQLIGTAHGNTLENLLRNPTLSDLVGGIESVTLSDDEARRRGTQKTVLERRAPPTFDVLIEIQTRHRLAVHEDVSAAVDAMLRGRPLPVELRYRNENGEINIENAMPQSTLFTEQRPMNGQRSRNGDYQPPPPPQQLPAVRNSKKRERTTVQYDSTGDFDDTTAVKTLPELKVYAYGVARNRLIEAAERLGVPMVLVDDMSAADVLVTIKTYYRRRPKLIVDAERRNIPIHVLRANTATQVEDFLSDVYNLQVNAHQDPFEAALEEARQAIQKIQHGAESVDLRPQSAYIRRHQHQLVRGENMSSRSYGKDPHRHVRVLSREISN